MDQMDQPVIKKDKRLTSVVWNDFERVKRDDIMVAICKHCKKKLSGSSTSGTSHLRNHLNRCLGRFNREINPQLLVVRERKRHRTVELENYKFYQEDIQVAIPFDQEHNHTHLKFDQERSRLDLARMIILHNYPVSMVEHAGFKRFVENLQPLFNSMSSDSAKADCLQIYGKEKQKVSETLNEVPGRISLTVELWTSSQGSRYLCLTAHYISVAWLLEKRVLNFVLVDPGIEHALSESIMACIMDWDIDRKLFSITFDSCSSNEDAVIQIRDRLTQNRLLIGNGQLFYVCCAKHVLILLVQDAFDAIYEIIYKIRESIKYVRQSEAVQQKFNELLHQVQANSKNLSLDSLTQWVSTYSMIEAAVEMRSAFSHLQDCDSGYTIALSATEWEKAIDITRYLKTFVQVNNVLSSANLRTSNHYFPEISDIHLNLIEWAKSSSSISSVALKSKCKFDAYWNICSLKLAIAAILDPRFKMKLVEYYYLQIYGNDTPEQLNHVADAFRDLYNEYSICSTLASLDQGLPCEAHNSGMVNGAFSSGNENKDRLGGFDKFLHDNSDSSYQMKSELDKYLEEPVFPRNMDFDVLSWWKVNSPKFPILSMMARDVLGIPMSSTIVPVTSENGGRVLDSDRSSLSPDILQALICTHDWLRS
ncbi:hypothetical protein Scep_027337 [Stephania cephalantha]|uniref:BED-type domain-containing protein n=1 Tax=Stephania cephalantha TaxID=152367 RepID=A0AAP0E7R1_9MAGN